MLSLKYMGDFITIVYVLFHHRVMQRRTMILPNMHLRQQGLSVIKLIVGNVRERDAIQSSSSMGGRIFAISIKWQGTSKSVADVIPTHYMVNQSIRNHQRTAIFCTNFVVIIPTSLLKKSFGL